MNEHINQQRFLSEAPVNLPANKRDPEFWSDAMVEMLSRLDIDYVFLLPGSSYRGLHELAGQLRPQSQAEDGAHHARADRRLDGARLRQGDRPHRRVHPARPGRPDERLDGRLQRVRRPRPGAGARRLGPARSRRPPLDRLAALRLDPGRHREELREMDRRADHAAVAPRRHRQGAQGRAHPAARSGLCDARLRHPGAEDHRTGDDAGSEILPAGAAGRRQSGRARGRRRCAAQFKPSGDRRWPLRHQSRRHQAAGRAGRAHRRGLSRRQRHDRVPDRASAERLAATARS